MVWFGLFLTSGWINDLCHSESKEAIDDGVEAKEEEAVEEGELVVFQGESS